MQQINHPYVGMLVTADNAVRHELLPNGRYVEARGNREGTYRGRYTVTGTRMSIGSTRASPLMATSSSQYTASRRHGFAPTCAAVDADITLISPTASATRVLVPERFFPHFRKRRSSAPPCAECRPLWRAGGARRVSMAPRIGDPLSLYAGAAERLL
jgi:hypothetical protein